MNKPVSVTVHWLTNISKHHKMQFADSLLYKFTGSHRGPVTML